MGKLLDDFLLLPRYSKKIIAIIFDANLCVLCTWLALIVSLEKLIKLNDFSLFLSLFSIVLAIPIFWFFGLYRIIFRFTGSSLMFSVLLATFIYGLLYFTIFVIYTLEGVPRSVGVLQPMLLFFGVMISRLIIKLVFSKNSFFLNSSNKKNIIVYGAGEAGREIVVALESSLEYEVVGFLDDNPLLHKQTILGKNVYSQDEFEKLIKKKNIDQVLLALPKISRSRRNAIIKKLNRFSLNIKTLPSISQLAQGKIKMSHIQDLYIDDLLNRDEIKPDYLLLNKNINSKVVLVTGAGGSIGLELCRQVLKLNPNKLILIELNEFSLYRAYEELTTSNKDLEIIPLLINTQDQSKLEMILETFKVHTVYHAAAYKHVPLVEENVCEGVKNNVFSTLAIAKASLKKEVSNFVLISSDKAVRPTNIMGASKRLSELCVQAIYNHSKQNKSNFSIVRFGNVLESSGSVIPKFKKQIKDGGPITLTHPEVTRYFMTVTEAAQLVIQAGTMGKKAEVFVLDMGERIKIKDLIYKMISLSGLKIKDDNNPNGDIKLQIIGLRPGEKLHEELLIGENPQKTFHKKIQKAQDSYIPFNILQKDLDTLFSLVENNNVRRVKEMLEKLIPLYKSSSTMVDHFYKEKKLENQIT